MTTAMRPITAKIVQTIRLPLSTVRRDIRLLRLIDTRFGPLVCMAARPHATGRSRDRRITRPEASSGHG